ncbi:MAG: TRAP-type C4-dicarboxylate transport system substrate-binding protein [Parasphingorhabdus sp.]|jgi:TRAP-type C4-dicarboxylate transport system substrate-binding protein
MLKKTLIAAAVMCGSFVGSAQAATTLNLSSWLPPTHPIVADMIKPWIEAVKKESGGSLDIRILPKPLGKPPAHFDLAKDGVADITYGVHGYQPGRFLLTKAVEMAFLGESAETISVAYWRIHQKHLAAADEHKGVQLLGLMSHGPGNMFNTKRALNTLADLNGLKIRVGGGVINDVAGAIGATPLLKPAPASYELVSNGVADGVFFPSESIKSFKLDKLIKHATLVPGGLYNTSFFLVANPASFAGLSQADQDALMRASGENFAHIAGKGWDAADQRGRDAMTAAGVAVITASDAMVAEIKAKTGPIEAAWVAAAKAKGIDGAMVMQDLRAEIAAQ